ncbi:DUF4265 domain-containing protein [Massilia sp. CCM 8695]|uniref:DUF4265 domain-containing protein n=1 Tax=Massilia frigida TaxID=2609281 RepID=A0ABX0NKR4_9BURK|nr:DUF4265 domain-containing protein [Massilia frigida]NHZ84203.1 DUF4265 domain-containing protein [Massilia frigida]
MEDNTSDGSTGQKNACLMKVFVAMRNGSPVFEQLPVRQLSEKTFELLSSPGLALNMAKGDVIAIEDPHKAPVVLQRGGNFCMQIYADALAPETITELENDIASKLGGTIDGIYRGNLSLSIPASVGMASIDKLLQAFTACPYT